MRQLVQSELSFDGLVSRRCASISPSESAKARQAIAPHAVRSGSSTGATIQSAMVGSVLFCAVYRM